MVGYVLRPAPLPCGPLLSLRRTARLLRPHHPRARQVLLASVIYLPLLYGLLRVDGTSSVAGACCAARAGCASQPAFPRSGRPRLQPDRSNRQGVQALRSMDASGSPTSSYQLPRALPAHELADAPGAGGKHPKTPCDGVDDRTPHATRRPCWLSTHGTSKRCRRSGYSSRTAIRRIIRWTDDVFKLGTMDGSLQHSTRFVLMDRSARIRGRPDVGGGRDPRL